ncbi:hypothetical protein KZI27_01610 [Curtobacterium sp. TC1]|uniref:hypothetical protein n=1 Tax=Curtobacterium sp. TC1 TaxID=2862880 RepID=UPI001C9AAD99|nr:hypothetical protein [Curtobacterium sp. TC1]QZQ55594.1 hypothetical protein KZI27_01610 [Curtobacterium sp. TC1]
MTTAAVVAIATTTTFMVLMDWLPTPLNRNIDHSAPHDRLPSTVIHGAAGIVMASCVARRSRWPKLAAAVWFSSVTVAALNNWWVPYFSGAASGEVTPETYEAEYSGNLRLLPPVSDHPVVPDVQHTLIHLGLLTSAVLSWIAFLTTPRRPR